MATVRSQLGSYVLFYVAIPVLLMLGVILRLSYVTLTTHNGDNVAAYAQQVRTDVESELRATALSIKESVDLDVLERLSDASSVENPLSQSLRAALRRNPQILNAFVTDGQGRVVASSELTTRKNAATEAWWKAAKASAPDELVADGVSGLNTVYIAMPLSDVGVIRMEIGLEQLVAGLSTRGLGDTQGFAVVAPKGTFKVGNPNLMERVERAVINRHPRKVETEGWVAGGRFRGERLRAPFDFPDAPLQVLAFIEEPLIPANQAVKLALIMLGCISFGVFIIMRADKAAERLGDGTAEIVSAGSILLHHMHGAEGDSAQGHKGGVGRRIEAEFNRWLSGVKQGVADNIETQNVEMERDQELAKEFQMAYLNRPYPLIPPRPTPGRLKLKFTHFYEPALALGGDFFEIMTLAPDTAGIFVADVMGHGTRSALITSSLRSLLHDLIPQGRNARHLVAEINKSFYSLLQTVHLKNPQFASAFYFVADVTSRAATYSTAGHPAPFHLHRPTNTLKRLEVPSPHGAALGINLKEEYTGGGCRIVGGDLFIFFTDGIYEAFNASGQEFGIEALEKVIRNLMHNSLEDITRGIADAVKEFTGGEILQDDLCVVAVEVFEC